MRSSSLIVTAAFCAAACVPAAAVGREDARYSVEGTPPAATETEKSPLDNVTVLKRDVAAGKWAPAELASLFAAGNAAGRFTDVAEVAEVALGTPASVRAEAEAVRAAAARAEERRTHKPPKAEDAGVAPKFYDGVAVYRGNARVWNEAGVAYYALNRTGDAVACFETAAARDALYDEPHANLGLVYRRKGWYEKALAEYDAALALGATNPTTWYNRGVCLLRLSRLEDAVSSLETANKFAPTYRPPIKRLAFLWYDLGDYETAYSYAERLAYLIKTDETATTTEKQAVDELLTLCENRIQGKKAQPALTVEGTAAPAPAPAKATGETPREKKR